MQRYLVKLLKRRFPMIELVCYYEAVEKCGYSLLNLGRLYDCAVRFVVTF